MNSLNYNNDILNEGFQSSGMACIYIRSAETGGNSDILVGKVNVSYITSALLHAKLCLSNITSALPHAKLCLAYITTDLPHAKLADSYITSDLYKTKLCAVKSCFNK